jgi:hypothetical protein
MKSILSFLNEGTESGYVLLDFSADYADEFDVEGFSIMTDAEWNIFQKKFQQHQGQYSFGFGSNEDIEFENGQEVLDSIGVKNITKEEYDTINKFFGTSYGKFPYDDYMDYEDYDNDVEWK